MTEPEARDLITRYVAAYNRFDVPGMVALFTDDVRFENISGGTVTASASGIVELRALAEKAVTLFSEREQRVTDIAFRDGMAVTAIAYRGVLAADIPNGPPAGTVIELTGESEFVFADGKISRLIDRS